MPGGIHTYEDLLKALLWPNAVAVGPLLSHGQPPLHHLSTICEGPGGFNLKLDVHHFAPREISVKTQGNAIVVEGSHEEKEEGPNSYVTQHFVRRYILPEEFDINHVSCAISSDGILAIVAPRVHIDENGVKSKPVPIMVSGVPASHPHLPAPHIYPHVHAEVPPHSAKPASHHL